VNNHLISEPGSGVRFESDFKVSEDPFFWENNEKTRDYLMKNGISQNKNCDFKKSERVYRDKQRFLSKSLFERKLLNGDIVQRDYLIYSPSQGSVFCAPCKLFGGTSQFGTSGFNDWKHASDRVNKHENSSAHRDCVLKFKARGSDLCKIDKQFLTQMEEEVKYWRSVLRRVVSVVKKLSSRGLPFRGDEEEFGSLRNGNFMIWSSLLNLIHS